MSIIVGKIYKYIPSELMYGPGYISGNDEHLSGDMVKVTATDGRWIHAVFISGTRKDKGSYHFPPGCLKSTGPKNKPGEVICRSIR